MTDFTWMWTNNNNRVPKQTPTRQSHDSTWELPAQCATNFIGGKEHVKWKAKSRKYQGVFEVKNRVMIWQVWGIWSHQLEHNQVPKWGGGAEPGVRKGKRSLLSWHIRRKCSMETTHNSVKVKVGNKVMKLVEVWLLGSHCWLRVRMSFKIREGKLHIAE